MEDARVVKGAVEAERAVGGWLSHRWPRAVGEAGGSTVGEVGHRAVANGVMVQQEEEERGVQERNWYNIGGER